LHPQTDRDRHRLIVGERPFGRSERIAPHGPSGPSLHSDQETPAMQFVLGFCTRRYLLSFGRKAVTCLSQSDRKQLSRSGQVG
jgi:hypothetical protein